MRFLMLNWRDPNNPLAGGAERVTQGYLSALAKRGHQVFWFAYDFPGATPIEIIEGVSIIRAGRIGTSIVHARQWLRRQEQFDLVVDQHHGIPWFAPWWARANCVAYVHEVLGPIWGAFYPWPISMLGRWQERWVHWLYRRVPFWTSSESTKKGLQQHGVRDVTLLSYGVDTIALSSLEKKSLEVPLKLIVVSRLAANKRIDHAIRALQLLLEKGLAGRLTIIGRGEVEPQLRRLVQDLQLSQQVVFTGQISEREKDAFLRNAHFLLHTSLREGWGLNVIEANAMGTPALVYPVEGLIDSTLHQKTGLVAAAETPESLVACLEAALAEPKQYGIYRRNAWERAKSFHWDNVLPKACDWLESQARKSNQVVNQKLR
jgi:glycosyltransferase involved in cell wall biosynthesis